MPRPSRSGTPGSPGTHWAVRLWTDCFRRPGLATAVVVAATTATALAALVPPAARIVVDDAARGETDRIAPLLGLLLGAALIQFAGSACRRFLSGKLALAVQHDLRTAVFDAVGRLDGGRGGPRTGQVMSRAGIDLQLVHGLLVTAPQALGALVVVVFAVTVMLWLSPMLTLVAIAVLFSFALVTARASVRIPPASMAVQKSNAEIVRHVEETITGARVVSAFGQEEREGRRLADLAGRLFGERVRAARVQAAPGATLGVLPYLGQVAVLILGAWSVSRGQVSLGTLVAFAGYMVTLTAPSAILSGVIMSAQAARPAVRRVYDLVDARPTVGEADDAVDVPEGPLGVELDGVGFGRAPDDVVLDGVSLSIRPGETLALVGGPGAGKSMVALLTARFHDVDEGSVRIGPPGATVDVRSLRSASLRSAVGVAFEEAFLFSGTIAENISYGRPGATEEEIREAARAAGADGFVSELPQGYDTPVGERGLTLSGGQRHRVALARALLGDPRLLVLDDATAAVDAATEAGMVDTLAPALADRTVLLVARRPALLTLADRVAVLDRGRVVDVGTREELSARCPLFRALCAEDANVGGGLRTVDGPPGEGELWPEPAPERRDPLEEGLPPADERPSVLEPGPFPEEKGGTDPAWGMRRVFSPVRALVTVALLLVIAEAAITTALPMILRWGLDHGVVPGDPVPVTLAGAATLVAVAVAWCVLYRQPMAIARVGEGALYVLRLRLFRHLHRLGPDHHERERGGLTTTRMTTDVNALSAFVESGLTILVVNGATIVAMAGAMLFLDPPLALTALAVFPVLVVATLVFRSRVSTAYSDARERIGEVNADLQEQVAGAGQTRASGAGERAGRRFAALSDGYRRARLVAQRHIALYFPFVTLMGDVSTALVLVVGAHRVADGSLSVGVLTAFILYLGMFYAPFQQLSVVFDGYQQARVGVDRIGELLRVPAVSHAGGATAVPVPRGPGPALVVVEGVSFTYPGRDRPALIDVDLTAGPGETVALMGETGAGKSTLTRLLTRFQDPDLGRVLVDGVDVRDLDPVAYRRTLGVVPQEVHLFSGSIADNVRYGRPEASDREVEEAVRAVGALDSVVGAPSGFARVVGERGHGLSVGQRRLLALARAHLIDPRILVFDEPSAGLDPATEALVLAGMERVARGRTAFVVTHSPAVAARADRIVVLAGGRVVEAGTHRELMALGGHYAGLRGSAAPAQVETGRLSGMRK
ncbi:ABC transporter ATP-binding protein [Nocardiopsis alba]|uniref:ABC transporter ATP-binding protein n=1 Tax=Nocardiopsis alba TaxID=53437 RepID=UPI00366C7E0A